MGEERRGTGRTRPSKENWLVTAGVTGAAAFPVKK